MGTLGRTASFYHNLDTSIPRCHGSLQVDSLTSGRPTT